LNSTPDTGEVDLSIFHNMRYGRAAPQLAQLAKTGNYSIERLNAAEIASRSHVNPVWYSADAIMGGVLSTVAFLPGVMDYFGKGTTAMVEEQMKSDAAWKDEQQAYMEQYAIQNLGLSPTTAHNIAVSDRQQIANQAYLDAWQRGTGPVWNEMVAAGTADPAYSAAPPTGY
jgi:hypothetical protein